MPGAVHVTKSEDIKESTGQTEVMIAHPHTGSAIHHHGEQETIVFAQSGHGTIVSNGGATRQHLAPGDFALIPAYAEHQEINEGEEEVVWIITRSGREPVVVNLKGWGGDVVNE
ncbi:RmlC-like cupin domain-containing protein [Halenospora varia]|nr:RmlC-like cupin domain-containing protein [Halenospora varia]